MQNACSESRANIYVRSYIRLRFRFPVNSGSPGN